MISEIDSSLYRHIYVCGDIHGHLKLLNEKLTSLNFDHQQDLLIAVGDLVDRGPFSFDCLQLINQPWFKSVKGNHEDFIEWTNDIDITGTHISNGGSWYYNLTDQEQQTCLNLVRQLPLILQTEIDSKKYAFIHAELPLNFTDWSDVQTDIQRPNFTESLLWGRSRITKNITTLVKNIDTIFCGHTVIKQPVILGNHYYIDTGSHYYGNLTVIQLK